MLNKITNPTEYINAVSKLLPYAIGKKKRNRTYRSNNKFTGTDEKNQSNRLKDDKIISKESIQLLTLKHIKMKVFVANLLFKNNKKSVKH